jgi:hypothetical protein
MDEFTIADSSTPALICIPQLVDQATPPLGSTLTATTDEIGSSSLMAERPRINPKILLRDRLPLRRDAAKPSIPLPPRPPRPRSAPLAAGTYSAVPSPVAAVWRRGRA